ncbi:heterokaryon incompatibility protein-domain-containing protein [Immersiella caudata]|uniref:Heterokaryon incompatibility protein-domain-containing protein n=1 Tax=Immersiella caudata TaxID=314043 RepID=A0AA39XCY0_9PEZI|nr:heterokaryon incompatibility protein-domain-containing protein [Immersiella caudata]
MEFTYPSSASPEELRLLKPTAITRNSLHFTLLKVRRAATPTYAAVSYTWGNDEPSEFIYLDNQKFYVRPNLWSCLYHLGQDAHHSRIKLWVDAICIDQTNNAERSSQVRRMDETYQRAAHVSVWLGLPKIPNHIIIPDHLQPVKTIEVDPFDWHDNLEDLANRSYWSRVWVIQEFLLGQNILLHCGNSAIRWNDFQSMLCHRADISQHTYDASFGAPGHPANAAAAAFRALPLVMARHVDKHPEFLQPLHTLLVSHHQAECKDPRDKIFGLLGLVTREERGLLERFFPDYTMSEDHVRVIALAHVLQYNTIMDGSEVSTSTKSEELFLGLGIRSARENRRYLKRAGLEAFDYLGDWGVGEA